MPSGKAAKLYYTLPSKDWGALLAGLVPERATPRNLETVGGYLAAYEPLFDRRPVHKLDRPAACREMSYI